MTAGIISLLVIILPVAVALFWRWLAKRDQSQPQKQHDEIAKHIVEGNHDAVNVGIADRLDAIDRLRNAHGDHPSGSGDAANDAR